MNSGIASSGENEWDHWCQNLRCLAIPNNSKCWRWTVTTVLSDSISAERWIGWFSF